MAEEAFNEARFRWVTADPSSILGDERPRSLNQLIHKDKPIWRELYRSWLGEYHESDVPKFTYVAGVEDGQLPRNKSYEPWRADLELTFTDFYEEVGDLKRFLDKRTGAARRLGRLAGKAGATVQKAASSTVAREVASATGTRSVRRVTGAVAKQVTKAAAPKRAQPSAPELPPRPEPPNLNEFAVSTAWAVYEFLGSEHLNTYVSWGWQLVGQLEWFGGEVGAHLARISSLMEEVAGWRQNAQAAAEGLQAVLASGPPAALPEAIKAARESAYGLAYYLDLLGYTANGEAPHQTVGRVVDDLAQQQAFYLSAMVAERLGELLRGFDALYFYASGALDTAAAVFRLEDPNYHADNLTDWGQPQVATLRTEVTAVMQYLESLPWAEEPYEPEEAMAIRYFGRSLTDLA